MVIHLAIQLAIEEARLILEVPKLLFTLFYH